MKEKMNDTATSKTNNSNIREFTLIDGLPCRTYPRLGNKQFSRYWRAETWWFNGKLHRENGPAVICKNYESWYLNGEYQRIEWLDTGIKRMVTVPAREYDEN